MTNLNLFGHELVVDNFAGGGGASEGIEQALGRPVDEFPTPVGMNRSRRCLARSCATVPRRRGDIVLG